MAGVKEQGITNETIRKKFFDIPNIEKQTATRKLTFIGRVARNSDSHITNTTLFRSVAASHYKPASVENSSKYLIFLTITTNILLWRCDIWALQTLLLKKP